MNRIEYKRRMLLLPLIILLTIGCSEQKVDKNEKLEKAMEQEVIPVPEDHNQASIEDIYEDPELYQESDKILEEREIVPNNLKNGIGKLKELIKILPERSAEQCVDELKNNPHDETLPCNQISKAYTKMSEIYWYMGELESDKTIQPHHYKHGEEAGSEGMDYNPNNPAASHWHASNFGSYLDIKYDLDCVEKSRIVEDIKYNSKLLEKNYLRTIEINSKLWNSRAYTALGRFYQKFYKNSHSCPTWIPLIDGNPLEWIPSATPKGIEAAFKRANYLDQTNFFPREYLFEFYKDQGKAAEAKDMATWLILNAGRREFRSKFPITAKRLLDISREYLKSHR